VKLQDWGRIDVALTGILHHNRPDELFDCLLARVTDANVTLSLPLAKWFEDPVQMAMRNGRYNCAEALLARGLALSDQRRKESESVGL
jgi:hypothetical protein